MTKIFKRLEEPAECLDCGLITEAENILRCSLDAYAEAGDYDDICPRCHNNQIKYHKPIEDWLGIRE